MGGLRRERLSPLRRGRRQGDAGLGSIATWAFAGRVPTRNPSVTMFPLGRLDRSLWTG